MPRRCSACNSLLSCICAALSLPARRLLPRLPSGFCYACNAPPAAHIWHCYIFCVHAARHILRNITPPRILYMFCRHLLAIWVLRSSIIYLDSCSIIPARHMPPPFCLLLTKHTSFAVSATAYTPHIYRHSYARLRFAMLCLSLTWDYLPTCWCLYDIAWNKLGPTSCH